ncbi:tetraacyldisaccharide 4'-kinase [Hippea jasoniae]|uniref:tetraacyldisaccharide 4'-kinase n=1 Tax=Hippea jasoniae TaxID=944479 RepID=UPI00054D5172|nr:tetraacyldisaccharide 4'-kinase [Hippea jasoniae]
MDLKKAKQLQKYLKPVLIPFSLGYGAIVNAKELYFSHIHTKKREFKNIKVIGVGNIAVGGVGKTPFVIELAKKLKRFGRVCIITNNYPLKEKRVMLVSLDGNIFKKPPEVNDESYMIAKKVPCSVIASKNRTAAIELALALNAKFVILDDALHLRTIKKDVEICLLKADKPFEDGFYLPAGLIRDSKLALKRCNFTICVNKTDQKIQPQLDCLEAKIKIKGVFDRNLKPIDIKDKEVVAFCGIADPQSFLLTLKKLGANVVYFEEFEDHHFYTLKDIEQLKSIAQEKLLITTYKDFVKLEEEKLNIGFIDIELKIENIDAIIEAIA